MRIRAATLGLFLAWRLCLPHPAFARSATPEESRVVIGSGGWELVGELRLPPDGDRFPAVLMLNQAAGDRTVYGELAGHLADRGVASLRIDLRGHGESTNLGRFVPGEDSPSSLIWDAEADVIAAADFLSTHAHIDGDKIGVVGASYSGEEMAEAGRIRGFVTAYVALSPGSFSEESILDIDASEVPWLFIVSKDDRFLKEITASVQERSRAVEMILVPGAEHATAILENYPGMAERIAIWLDHRLR
jgi:dienelactone hydrolase